MSSGSGSASDAASVRGSPEREAAAEAEEAADADADADAPAAEREPEAAEEAQPEAQGGGAPAPVVKAKKKKRKRDGDAHGVAIVPTVSSDRLTALTIVRGGGRDETIHRPQAGDHSDPVWALWRYADAQSKQVELTKKHLARAHSAWREQREPLLGAMRALNLPVPDDAAAPPPGPGPATIPRALLHDDPGDLQKHGRDRFKSKRAACQLDQWNRLCRDYYLELVEDVADRDGRLYTPGPMPGQQELADGGNNKDATLCGAFPHALVRHKIGRLKDKALFVCASTHAVVITVKLRRKGVPRADGPVSERGLLDEVHQTLSDAELPNRHGEFENSLIVYAELQFQCSDQDAPAARIDPSAAFKVPPPADKLLSPQNSAPYAGGYQEVRMVDGVAEMQFSFNKNVTSSNLNHEHKNRLFQVAIWTLNPYLCEMRGFRKTSSPFVIKATLHNDIQHRQRWVEAGDGKSAVLLTDPSRVVREAPASRNTAVLQGAAAAAARTGVEVRVAVPEAAAGSSSEDEDALTWQDQLAIAGGADGGSSESDSEFQPTSDSDDDHPSSSECDSDANSDLDPSNVLRSEDEDERDQ